MECEGASPSAPSTSADKYHQTYWPKLAGALTLILNQTPGQFFPISYEEMYTAVYKCVCQNFGQILYSQLLEHVRTHLQCVAQNLQNQPVQAAMDQFLYLLEQFTQAVDGIVPVFQYMNRFFVIPRLKQDLTVVLFQLFIDEVAESGGFIVTQALQQDLVVNPNVLMTIAQRLYALSPAYASRHPALFVRFIPSLFAQSEHTELDKYITEDSAFQLQLEVEHRFTRESCGRKRLAEEEEIEEKRPSYAQPPLSRQDDDSDPIPDIPMELIT